MSDMPTPTSPSRIEAEFPWLKMATADEQRFVDEALRYFEDPGTVHHALAFLGRPIEALSEKLPAPAKKIIEKSTDHALNLALQSALNVIEAKAHFDAPERTVHVRIGGLDGRLYLDLCDETWRAVEIDASGWRGIDHPPGRFRRAAGMQAPQAPGAGGSSFTQKRQTPP